MHRRKTQAPIHPRRAKVKRVPQNAANAPEENPLRQLDSAGVLLLTLNRPARKNAFDEAQWHGLARALNQADADPRCAAVVLTGAGGNFSSGVDLASFGGGGDSAGENASGFYALRKALFAFAKPLIAAVAGVAVGGGCTIAIAADILYLGESARLRLPFAALGLVPELAGSYTLQAAVGRQRAAELMFSAEWINAARAHEVGLAARVLPDEELLPAALAKARAIAQWPVSGLRAIKKTLQAAQRAGIEGAFAAEDEGMAAQIGTPENLEALRAFAEKRKPDFSQFRKAPAAEPA